MTNCSAGLLIEMRIIIETATKLTSPLRYEILKLIACHRIISILHVLHDRDSPRLLIAMIMDYTAIALTLICIIAGARLVCWWDLIGDLNDLTARRERIEEALSWQTIWWIIKSSFLIELGIHPGRIFDLIWMVGRAWYYASTSWTSDYDRFTKLSYSLSLWQPTAYT